MLTKGKYLACKAKICPSLLCLTLLCLVAPACRQAKNSTVKPETIKTKSGVEMVAILGGWFEMGSDNGAPDELPVHKVWISPFWMDKYEVTQDQFKKYQLPDPSHFKNPSHPLEQINWTDAALYCNERSRAEGLEPCYNEQTWQCSFDANGYRLPTESEWEYACRAGAATKYYFGNDQRKVRMFAWFTENSSGRTQPVGQKKPNPWGLFDMCGNVAEWCNDLYSYDYYKHSPDRDPKGPDRGKERVLRGGAWNSSADSCRSARRASDPSIDDTCLASDAIGFRCVRKAPSNASTDPNAKRDDPAPATAKTGLVYHDIYLEHKTTEGHPERPERLTAIIERLRKGGLYAKLCQLTPSPVPLEWLTTVHRPGYVERVKRSCQENARYIDSIDTPISPRSYEAALLAAGGVLCAIDAVMEGKVTNAFCAIRPPGHHAMPDQAMGFCIFNNVAVGAKYIQKKYGLRKVLIVDWDVHHGNGTQAVFYNDPTVLYFSVHQYPFYPGTGSQAEKGTGAGLNHTINVPLSAGEGDVEFVRAFRQKLEPAALAFSPDFVLVSAGFDAHYDDPLGGMQVTEQGFAELTRIVKAIAEKYCQGRLVSVLEGGYSLGGLAASVESHIRVLMG